MKKLIILLAIFCTANLNAQIRDGIYSAVPQNKNMNVPLTLQQKNIIIGGSIIGFSFAAYSISTTAINNSIQKNLENYEGDHSQAKIDNLNTAKSVIGYTLGAASLAGAFVILNAATKEYAPDNVNLISNETGVGISYSF